MENQLTPLSIATLSKYIFGDLPDAELAAIEERLAEDEYYFNIVENLLDYCERKNILNHEDLTLAFALEKHRVFEEMEVLKEGRKKSQEEIMKEVSKEAPATSGQNNYRNRWLWLTLFLMLLISTICFFVFYKSINQTEIPPDKTDKTEQIERLQSKPQNTPEEIKEGSAPEETPSEDTSPQKPVEEKKSKPPRVYAAAILTEPESSSILTTIHLRESKSLRTAGGNNWQSAFLNSDMSAARQLLDQEILDHPDDILKIQWYFAGILQLYSVGGELPKAINYLEKAGRFRTDTQLHLINAYAKNKDIAKAKAILQAEPEWWEKLPSSVRELLEK